MPNILDLSARLSADVKPFVNSMGSSAQSSRTTFQNIAQAATMYLGGRGLLGTLQRASEASRSFGQSLADASAISTLSVKEIQQALMSLDNVFGRVSKASSSMYRILSSGFSQLDAKQLVDFQKAVGVSAKVIRADLYDTADVMTTIANAYQLNIKQIEKLQDWFYITVREGKAQGQDLARTLGLVINSASEAGVSLNELGAAIAVLSRTQSASQSMIGLNQMLNAFIKPTLQAKAAAREWGVELSASAIQNKSLIEILTELNKKVGGNVEALEAMFGNIRAGRAILSITGKQFKNYNQVLKMYEAGDGAGLEAFLKQIDTVENAYERLQAQQEKTLITIGDDWSGVLKKIYGAGELALKSFTDVSPFNRWVIYLSGIGLAVKNIISVVRNLQSSIDATTRSVNNLASAFNRTSLSSAGLRGIYHGVRPDTMALRKELDSALRTVSSPYGVLSARYKNVMAQTTPYTWGTPQQGGFFKDDAYAFIAKHMLSRDVAEHRNVASKIARGLMAKRFVKYKDITDANGNVVDWHIMNAATGKKYTKTYNEYENIMTESVLRQNELAIKALRGDLASAIQVISKVQGDEQKILADATARVGAFYSKAKGARVSSLYGLTSTDRLLRMQQKGIFSGTSLVARGAVFRNKGFLGGMKNEFTIFGKSIGTGLGKAFSAVAVVGLMSAVAEAGYRFGEALGEKLELSESTFIRRLGGWIANLETGGKIGNTDSKESMENAFRTQIDTVTMQYKQSIETAKKLGMDAHKIAEYQLSFMNIFGSGSDLEKTYGKLKELVDGFVSGLNEINSGLAEANKFEQERKRILDTYKNVELDELYTSKQKVSILDALADKDRQKRDQAALQLADRVFANPTDHEIQAEVTSLFNVSDNEDVNYAKYQDYIIALRSKIINAVVESLFSGDVTISGLETMLQRLKSNPTASLALENGVLTINGRGNNVSIDDLETIIRTVKQFPNNRNEAFEELKSKKLAPYAETWFNELMKKANDASDSIIGKHPPMDWDELQFDANTKEDVLLEKAKKSEQYAANLRDEYNKWLEDLINERNQIVVQIVQTLRKEHKNLTEKEIKAVIQERLLAFDEVMGTQAEEFEGRVERASQTALSQSAAYYKERFSKIADNDRRFGELDFAVASGVISKKEAVQKTKKIYEDMFNALTETLKNMNSEVNPDAYRAVEKQRNEVLSKLYGFMTESALDGIESLLSDALDRIDFDLLTKKVNQRQASSARIHALERAIDKYDEQLALLPNKDSEQYRHILKLKRDAQATVYNEQQNIQTYSAQKRSQLMDSVSGVISSNIENGYITSYGLHHAMSMLAKLKSGFTYDLGGASLKDVLNNARARYSGYTPNTSKAMQAQRKLSEIMDTYITAKQYEDAGISKNVETIVTLMGKRQPLYLN